MKILEIVLEILVVVSKFAFLIMLSAFIVEVLSKILSR